jgi:hypothetical protein
MILWHVGGAIFLFRAVFRDPKVDLRLLAVGAVAPDLLDLLVGVVAGEPFRQRWGHTLIVPSLLTVVIMLATRRGRRRRQLMTVIVAWMFHLILDGVWVRQQTLFWPFFGWDFAAGPGGTLWDRAFADPWRWAKEALGAGYLVLLWRRLPARAG